MAFEDQKPMNILISQNTWSWTEKAWDDMVDPKTWHWAEKAWGGFIDPKTWHWAEKIWSPAAWDEFTEGAILEEALIIYAVILGGLSFLGVLRAGLRLENNLKNDIHQAETDFKVAKQGQERPEEAFKVNITQQQKFLGGLQKEVEQAQGKVNQAEAELEKARKELYGDQEEVYGFSRSSSKDHVIDADRVLLGYAELQYRTAKMAVQCAKEKHKILLDTEENEKKAYRQLFDKQETYFQTRKTFGIFFFGVTLSSLPSVLNLAGDETVSYTANEWVNIFVTVALLSAALGCAIIAYRMRSPVATSSISGTTSSSSFSPLLQSGGAGAQGSATSFANPHGSTSAEPAGAAAGAGQPPPTTHTGKRRINERHRK